jgi:cytidine kinase
MKTNDARLIVVGSVGIDTVHTPHGSRSKVPGGSAPYFSYAASLFAKVRMIGVVGCDYPKSHRRILESRPIDLSGLEVDGGNKTFAWEGKYKANMIDRDTLRTDLNALAAFDPKIPADFRKTPYVFLANVQPSLQMRVLDQMDGRQTFVAADTMNLWINTAAGDLKKLLPRIDMLILNDEEARMLSGKFTLPDCAAAIRKMGPAWVLIKKGEHGSICFGKNGVVIQIPAYPLARVADPTGAGDSYAGGLMGRMAQRNATPDDVEKLRDAMAHASAAGSFACEGFGFEGLKKMNSKTIRERVGALREMCRIP